MTTFALTGGFTARVRHKDVLNNAMPGIHMNHFFCKYIPPRSDFLDTLSAVEVELLMMQRYWQQGLAKKRRIVACGPVLDPNGAYGVALYTLSDDEEITALLADDPLMKAGLGAYECHPMLEVTALR